jgi:2-Cys peroxiredoxin 5
MRRKANRYFWYFITLGEPVINCLGVPGAFTPGCSKTHLPGYVQDYEAFKSKGIDEIVCVSVNDPFVMAAWGENQNATGKIRMLADTNASLACALGMVYWISVWLPKFTLQVSILMSRRWVTTKECEDFLL